MKYFIKSFVKTTDIAKAIGTKFLGNCETGLAFDAQKRQRPDFVGDEQEKVDAALSYQPESLKIPASVSHRSTA